MLLGTFFGHLFEHIHPLCCHWSVCRLYTDIFPPSWFNQARAVSRDNLSLLLLVMAAVATATVVVPAAPGCQKWWQKVHSEWQTLKKGWLPEGMNGLGGKARSFHNLVQLFRVAVSFKIYINLELELPRKTFNTARLGLTIIVIVVPRGTPPSHHHRFHVCLGLRLTKFIQRISIHFGSEWSDLVGLDVFLLLSWPKGLTYYFGLLFYHCEFLNLWKALDMIVGDAFKKQHHFVWVGMLKFHLFCALLMLF